MRAAGGTAIKFSAVASGRAWIRAHDAQRIVNSARSIVQAAAIHRTTMHTHEAAPPGAGTRRPATAGRTRMVSSVAATPGLMAVGNSAAPTPVHDCGASSLPDTVLVVPSASEAADSAGTAMSIFSGLPDPPGVLYEILLAIHSTGGLGWAGTLVLSTVLMRLSMLPISVYSDRNSRKFAAMVAPELGKLYQDLSPVDTLGRPRKFESTAEFWQLQKVAFNAVRKLWRRHRCSPLKTLASPLVQLPLFVSASVAIRRLCGPFYDELQTGGALWFPDLTIAAMNGFFQV